jgi:hypothetical protein
MSQSSQLPSLPYLHLSLDLLSLALCLTREFRGLALGLSLELVSLALCLALGLGDSRLGLGGNVLY